MRKKRLKIGNTTRGIGNELYNKFKDINYGRNIKCYDYVFDSDLLWNNK